jgi:cellulose biosynthesis protein BcsQ
MNRPFIVTLASEKGGVGKTTIATNLAVYLKALREDLPVTIMSFDNHFSVDQMFAIGGRSRGSVADLLAGRDVGDLVEMGEYGVQFIASERRLVARDEPPQSLSGQLRSLPVPGILVIDTRPILDWFTKGGVMAANIVLVPVKDRASLVNASAIRALLEESASVENLWLLPSLVDARARLNAEMKVIDFLVYSAGERDFQVVDTVISKSPKVESLSSGFSSRVYPVLTHARQTAVHGQLHRLAEFVLNRYDSHRPDPTEILATQDLPSGRLRHLDVECPVCHEPSIDVPGHFYFDLRSRRCGFLHSDCLESLSAGMESLILKGNGNGLAFSLAGPGVFGHEPEVTGYLIDANGNASVSEGLCLNGSTVLSAFEGMTGQTSEEWHRETVLIELQGRCLEDFTAEQGWSDWCKRRRNMLWILHNF